MANWEPGHSIVLRYEVGADGAAGPGELLVDLSDEPGEDSLDGLKVDTEGNLYICGPGGIHLIAPDGRRLGLIRLPEAAHNLTWGDVDAFWPFLADTDFQVRSTLEIDEYTDPHHKASVPHTLLLAPGRVIA